MSLRTDAAADFALGFRPLKLRKSRLEVNRIESPKPSQPVTHSQTSRNHGGRSEETPMKKRYFQNLELPLEYGVI